MGAGDDAAGLDDRTADLDKEIARRAREDEMARRLMTIPGIGPIAATAIVALASPVETFTKGRDFAAWLRLVPLKHLDGRQAEVRPHLEDGRMHHPAVTSRQAHG